MQATPRTLPPAGRLLAAAAIAAAVAPLSGCATGPERNPADPLEPLNRATWRFNDALDRTVAKPVARGYNKVVPSPIRTGVSNFFSNLGDVTVAFNDFAQGRFKDGMSDVTRFAVNSTFGVLGLFDVAGKSGIQKHDQDFGLTLGHYGVPTGPYLVLPLFGPSTFRDAAGTGVDQYIAPANQMDPAWRNSLWGVNFVSARARYLDATNLLEQAALDKYLFVRDAWLAQRQSKLDEGKQQDLPDYDADQGGGSGGASGGGGGAGSGANAGAGQSAPNAQGK
ncbi:VacJ family lipoprotein [Massilia sp. 9096]|uniref:MlaA family lipoprotein n=1 Tax=Massilia sp. 9096 TaxID=1500894 RepID=UPI00068BA444|nr:VacJ family lipoprotein [Massilia sp. 9096]